MPRGNQVLRQWKVIRALEARRYGATVDELAEETDYHRRTIYRDLEVLEALGFPLEREKIGDRVRWRMPADAARRAPIPFTPSELLALYMSRSLMRGTTFAAGMESALEKIRMTLPVDSLDFLAWTAESLVTKVRPAREDRDAAFRMELILQAARERSKIRVAYRVPDRERPDVHVYRPYAVVPHEGAVYAIGHSELRNALRTLRIDRIERVELLPEPFEVPDDFDPETLLAQAFGIAHEGTLYNVSIQFSVKAAPLVRGRIWHPTQSIAVRGGGRILLSFKASGLAEIARWVLSFGAEAVVKSPPALRERVAAEARGLAKLYP